MTAVAADAVPASARQLQQQQQPQQQAAPPANRSKKQEGGSKKKKGGRGAAPAEEVEVKGGQVNLVRLRYEGKQEPVDDPTRVQLSKVGKASQLQLSEDRLGVTGHKGFKTARASHGVHEGAWYCEVRVSHLGRSGHCRLGWCTRKAELQAPVGFDTFGFSYRDIEGSKVTEGRREPYGEPFVEGDVIGLYIYLPPGGKTLEPKQNEYTKYKGKWMRIEDPEPKADPLPGSVIAFTRNGVLQGVAFRDFLEGTYHPAASLYTLPEQAEGATVAFSFGPDFVHAPPVPEGCAAARPMCEMATAPGAGPAQGPGAGPGPGPGAGPGAAAAAAAAEAGGADADAGAMQP